MKNKIRKIKKYTEIIRDCRWVNKREVGGILTCPCGYKEGHTPPPAEQMTPFNNGDLWGSGHDTHAWFTFTLPAAPANTYLKVETDRNGWDADNPQFIAYINGKMIQGLDTNHREVALPADEAAEVSLYAYVGPKLENARLFVSTMELCPATDALYYDIRYPLDMLDYLDKEGTEYAAIVDYLWRAVSMLDLYEVGSKEFIDSAERAHKFLESEFYGKYCTPQKATTVGIGHTHIDCAWLWTLKQTREKVQRSFSTVLELMRHYPEYKFMSSQAFLYQNLKEEAPEIYAEVAKRIKEGRWECEGAMWVEADCNLSSGESLVRQVLYAKNFFKDEFGVENRVLWLPDVFGYAAALPQILRKSGIDWFVTSKISWNDTDRMPFETFRWRGIDGSEINTHFLTAGDDRGGKTHDYCTYVGNTGAKMVQGTYRRYSQKSLNDEAILTFGYGDGGGGPTREHLELAKRGAKGVPGSPNLKIDFAGKYLDRLAKRMEERTDVPSWQGELYLEFHRGTYTSISKNKRNNRQSEFLYGNAELLGVTAELLLGKAFPKSELHRGWEMILTNQFHDIIPGSSIKEVYDQCDVDYAVIKGIGNGIVDSVREQIASKLDSKGGYVLFNPHSFTTEGMVNIGGTTVMSTEKIPSKGYLLTDSFIDKNDIVIDGRHVETERLSIAFDEYWQLVSVYDKKAEREVLRKGEVGNELRIHADYPDQYDAWEWQSYSREEYRTLREFSEVSVVNDGIRKGIKIVRPYMNSTINQTIWFYDSLCRIDFETLVDWHDTHKMLKAAFPVDINSSKATYEIQFGTVERPTHMNTSWDSARFEVCAHKYADLSDGGYGVALMNDCKYGHDIHDGVIQLSLLRSSTYPDPEADQGLIPFTYSLVPHENTLSETDVAKQAYYLNYPMVALAASADTSSLPESFSVLSLDKENVICETVKQAERSEDTVVRLYENANKRTRVSLKMGTPFKKAYLCDLMENALEELPMTDHAVSLTLSGFELVTVKFEK